MALLQKTFPSAVGFQFRWPLVIVRCTEPPDNVPLTIGSVPAIFLAVDDTYNPIPGTPGNPRIPDFLAEKRYDADKEDRFDLCTRVLESLCEYALSPLSVSYYLGALVIELQDDIAPSSLPGRLAGLIPFYSNGSNRAWKDNGHRQGRLITPNQETVDVSNYSESELTPGVRICGQQYAGTSGLLLRNQSGERRLMVANHIFQDTEEVYHPTMSAENHIGTITKRYPALDVALVALDDHVCYTNGTYFDAPVPRKLVSKNYSGMPGLEWFFIDFPFSGVVPFLWAGVYVGKIPERPTDSHHHLQYDRKYVFLSMHINVGQLPDGICGSPVVHEEAGTGESDGAVVGLFNWSDRNVVENLFVCVLDEIVADGWEVECS
jgi:hypothetical protein